MEELLYVVVRNHEDQYSIWDADRPVPQGWVIEGEPLPKEECLEYIRNVWTDMTPRSLRKSTSQ
jgi:MbtH protein